MRPANGLFFLRDCPAPFPPGLQSQRRCNPLSGGKSGLVSGVGAESPWHLMAQHNHFPPGPSNHFSRRGVTCARDGTLTGLNSARDLLLKSCDKSENPIRQQR
jgi:hypothetical protein